MNLPGHNNKSTAPARSRRVVRKEGARPIDLAEGLGAVGYRIQKMTFTQTRLRELILQQKKNQEEKKRVGAVNGRIRQITCERDGSHRK